MKEYHKSLADEDLSPRDVILTVKGYVLYLWTWKWWIILAGIIGIIWGVYVAWRTPPSYTAQLTYMLNNDESDSFSSTASLLNQFGVGAAAGNEYNLAKIVALSRSRRIISKVLLDSAKIADRTDLVANHLIDDRKMHEKWKDAENEELRNFYFQDTANIRDDRTASSVLLLLHKVLVGDNQINGITESSFNEGTGILWLRATTGEEELSKIIVEKVYAQLSEFYISSSTGKQIQTLARMESKVDSISRALHSAEYRLARQEDRSSALLLERNRLGQSKLYRDVQILTIMYGEALKSLERANVILQSTTPFLQVLDDVMLPIRAEKPSMLKTALQRGVLMAMLLSAILFLLHLYKNIMREEEL